MSPKVQVHVVPLSKTFKGGDSSHVLACCEGGYVTERGILDSNPDDAKIFSGESYRDQIEAFLKKHPILELT